ncbi:porin family protein [Simiduia agarivorans]|uniref:OmpA-like transmembrane domain-containing protein n=1 Tax=Simiduia agarivorans (strain DSM 21679 / JCM 13881 / BCRC 17597 / SA1) TaxID=1117647 RepID=K4KJZ2_SIMAS|nr:porin family protein [Simiduia agarivorans]AFU98343.1 OmpA-like transmembrane domain-containing protein [Simiduia agarivorans SA1 = DSM 21679]
MKKTLLASTCLILGLAQPAFAGDETGFYLGGSVGSSQLSYKGDGSSIDDDDVGYKVFAGYNFGLIPLINLAVEGSYVDFGSQTGDILGDSYTLTSTGLQGHALAGVNLGPVGLFAKAGVMNWDSKLKGDAETTNESGSDPAYGVGAKFQLMSFQLRAEYERLQLDDADVDFFSVGAAYTF